MQRGRPGAKGRGGGRETVASWNTNRAMCDGCSRGKGPRPPATPPGEIAGKKPQSQGRAGGRRQTEPVDYGGSCVGEEIRG